MLFFQLATEPSSSIEPEALSSSLHCTVSLQYWTLVRILRSGSSYCALQLRVPFSISISISVSFSSVLSRWPYEIILYQQLNNSLHTTEIKNPPYPTLPRILSAPNPINLLASLSPTPSASSTVPTTSQILSSTISFSFFSPSTTLKTCPLNSKTPVFSSQQLSTATGALHPPFNSFKKLLSALHVSDVGMWFNGDNNLRIRASEWRISRPRAPWPGAWRILFLFLLMLVLLLLFCDDKYSLIRPSKPIRLRPAAARIRQSYFCLLLLLSSSFRSRVCRFPRISRHFKCG